MSGCGGGGDGEQAAETVQGEATQVAGGEKAGRGALEVELNEWDVIPAKDATQPGKVTFQARNTGSVPHALEVILTDVKAGAFPVKGGVAEVKGKKLADVGDIAGGASKQLSVILERGHYALICNLPGHYEAGMHSDFQVE